MDLRQLEYFQMVSQLGSITKAAERLHIAQPSVSISIQKLEEELGVILFDRSQRQILLTSEGHRFSRHVNHILTSIHDATAEMKDISLLQKGTIRVGVPPMVGAFLFSHIFLQFRKAYPGIELIAEERGSLSILPQLEQGALDVGIITIPNASRNLEIVPITVSQFLVCMAHSHLLGRHSVISFCELIHEPFILLNADTYSRYLIIEECRKHQFNPQIVFSSSQTETIFDLVEQGVGISFFLDVIVKKHPNVIARPLKDPLYLHIALAWNKNRYLSKSTTAFIDFVTSLQL